MKFWGIAFFSLFFGFFLMDFLFSQKPSEKKMSGEIPFEHKIHGNNIGIDCSKCHTGAFYEAYAYMPSKKDCMDCHRLPLTENPLIETLDSTLKNADNFPWKHKKILPDHVVFHHGVHYAAGVRCEDCHNISKNSSREIYGGELFSMKMCLDCHSGKIFSHRNFKAATYCGACHR